MDMQKVTDQVEELCRVVNNQAQVINNLEVAALSLRKGVKTLFFVVLVLFGSLVVEFHCINEMSKANHNLSDDLNLKTGVLDTSAVLQQEQIDALKKRMDRALGSPRVSPDPNGAEPEGRIERSNGPNLQIKPGVYKLDIKRTA